MDTMRKLINQTHRDMLNYRERDNFVKCGRCRGEFSRHVMMTPGWYIEESKTLICPECYKIILYKREHRFENRGTQLFL